MNDDRTSEKEAHQVCGGVTRLSDLAEDLGVTKGYAALLRNLKGRDRRDRHHPRHVERDVKPERYHTSTERRTDHEQFAVTPEIQ
jgi:hypothetical protein